MANYVTLIRWTQKGIENVKDSPSRYDAFKDLVRSLGGAVKETYMLMGQYDLIVVIEAPSADVVAKALLATCSKGAVSTETLRAFTEEEYRTMIATLP